MVIEGDTSGFNINTIGVILLIAGIVVLVIGVIVLAKGSRRHSMVREDIQQTPTGSARVEEWRDDLI